ncbi:helix-turn-helix domain-containing protein [Virgibacillus kimchii]
MTFGEFIKEKRTEKGLTMRELERRTGISQAYISQIESGKRNVPKPELIKKISNGLDVDYLDLLQKAGYIGTLALASESYKSESWAKKPINKDYVTFLTYILENQHIPLDAALSIGYPISWYGTKFSNEEKEKLMDFIKEEVINKRSE